MTAEALETVASRHQVFYEGLKTQEAKKVDSFLQATDRQIRKRLADKDLTTYTRKRLEILLVSVSKDLGKISDDFVKGLDLDDIAQYEADFEIKSLSQAAINHTWVVPTAAQLRAAVFSNPLSMEGVGGEVLLKPFLKGIKKSSQEKVSNAIRQGWYQGESTNTILQRIRGTRAAGFSDGIIARVGNDSRTIVRTSLQHLSNQARQEVWSQNEDVIKGVRIVATLDNKTSSVCRGLDGQVFPIDRGPRPPFHPNCRTTTVAVLHKKFDSLSRGATRRARGADGKVTSVPRDQTYYGWLKKQPAKFQDSVIGPTRGKLLRNGGISAQRFQEMQLNKRFKPITLKKMKDLDPVAFDKALGPTTIREVSSKSITSTQLANQLGVTPQALRKALRKSDIPKPAGGWNWAPDSPEIDRVRALFSKPARQVRPRTVTRPATLEGWSPSTSRFRDSLKPRAAKRFDDAVRKTLAHQNRTGNEMAVWFDEFNVKSKAGEKAAVNFTSREISGMKRKYMVHNHPSGGSLSGADIHFANSAGIVRMVAVAKDGTVYHAGIRPGYRYGMVRDAQRFSGETLLKNRKAIRGPKMDIEDYYLMDAHVANQALHLNGAIDYVVEPSRAWKKIYEANKDLIDQAAEDLARKIK